jgi:hypothetical protein
MQERQDAYTDQEHARLFFECEAGGCVNADREVQRRADPKVQRSGSG